jgi:hypothetical protein
MYTYYRCEDVGMSSRYRPNIAAIIVVVAASAPLAAPAEVPQVYAKPR